MKDLREQVGTNACTCIVSKIVKSPMKWAGHMVRMKDCRKDLRQKSKEVAENGEDNVQLR